MDNTSISHDNAIETIAIVCDLDISIVSLVNPITSFEFFILILICLLVIGFIKHNKVISRSSLEY